MIKSRNIGKFTEISSDSGYIHEIGTENYFKKGIVYKSIDLYEEVTELPKYTKAEYDLKVAELIKEKYSTDEEMCIQRKMFKTLMTPAVLSEEYAERYYNEFTEYDNYVEECKIKAKEILSNGKEG